MTNHDAKDSKLLDTIIYKLQIGIGIALFSKLEYFNVVMLSKISLQVPFLLDCNLLSLPYFSRRTSGENQNH